MAAYYLMAQLPSLDCLGESAPPPITEERFLQLCRSFLGKKAQRELDKLTLLPPRDLERSNSPLINAWNTGERNLRLALGKFRAERLEKDFNDDGVNFSSELQKAARAAVEIKDPMEAEKFLLHYRLDFLETLRPMDMFSDESVFYYGLKLKLLLRTSLFDTAAGRAAYRSIYSSILNGDQLEVQA